jgi:hypothetical protein
MNQIPDRLVGYHWLFLCVMQECHHSTVPVVYQNAVGGAPEDYFENCFDPIPY